MIASLAMYSRPETRDGLAAFWNIIRDRLRSHAINAPENLSQEGFGADFWLRDDLVLSQACSRPYRLFLKGKVKILGAFDYGLDGCKPGYYQSVIVVRKGDRRVELSAAQPLKLAINDENSHSGFGAFLRYMGSENTQPHSSMITGSHRASAKAVASGAADMACLDAVSWEFMKRYDDIAPSLRVLDWTAPSPGLPLITRLEIDRDIFCQVLAQSVASLSNGQRNHLMIRDFVALESRLYD